MSCKLACQFTKNKQGDLPKDGMPTYHRLPQGSFKQACSLPRGSLHSATGGGNSDAGSCGKNICLNARKGNVSRWKVTSGVDFTAKPVQLIGMRKGSVFVQSVATKGLYAMLVVSGAVGKLAGQHRSRNITEQSARQKVHGELYYVFQKSMQQQWQLIVVG